MQLQPKSRFLDQTIVGIALVLPTIVTWVYFILLNDAPELLQKAAYSVGKLIQFALPVVWVCLIRRERQNLNRPSAWSLITGALFGLLVAAAMYLLFVVLKQRGILVQPIAAVRAKIESFGVSSPEKFAVLAIFYSAFHSLLEEYYWRWFVFGQLSRSCRLPAAIIISGAGFAAHHILVLSLYFGWASPLTWLFSLAIAIGGAFWAWLYRASDSLAAPWLSHALVDAAIFAFGYQILTTAG